jgi:Transposase
MRAEVLDGVERRRRWSRGDKMRITEETLAPCAVVTEIARRHGIATSLVFTWRRRARLATVARLTEVVHHQIDVLIVAAGHDRGRPAGPTHTQTPRYRTWIQAG